MNARPTNVRTLSQAGFSLLPETLDSPLFQITIAAAIVSNA
jgi:hypothetical protein